MNIFERFREAWSVFRGRDHPGNVTQFNPGYGTHSSYVGWYMGPSSSDRPDRRKSRPGNDKTIITSIQNRIALDVASVEFHHANIDENGMFKEAIEGSLEDFMNLEANIDETSQAYMIDLVMSMLDEGVVAEVPVEYEKDPDSGKFSDKTRMQVRVGKIKEWRPQFVKVEVYNEQTGQKEDVDLPKRDICIIENPFYAIMNHNNGIYRRLLRKMSLMDMIHEKQGSDKLNAVVQLPYIVRTDVQRATARNRLKEMEDQLKTSELGITYVDGTEKLIQLNRPIETNLQSQIEWLTNLLFSQLCITQEILNGTADEKTMTNYMNRCIAVICSAIASERRRKLLTDEQRRNKESIVFNQDPFKLIPVTLIADIADKLTRNAVLSPNEVRGIIGYKASEDKAANQLVNRNMPMNQTPEGAESGNMVPGEGPPAVSEMQQSGMPMNRAQRRQMARSKVPR